MMPILTNEKKNGAQPWVQKYFERKRGLLARGSLLRAVLELWPNILSYCPLSKIIEKGTVQLLVLLKSKTTAYVLPSACKSGATNRNIFSRILDYLQV